MSLAAGIRATIYLAAALFLGVASSARAQDMEPRSYSNAPIGLNFLVAGYVYTQGGAAFDSSLPITNPKLTTNSAVLAYARVLDFWGQSAKLSVIVPYGGLTGTAEFAGRPQTRDVSGFADPAFKLSVNLYGAPSLSLKEFASYEQDLIVGASLRVTAPLGQYDDNKAVNIGTNRWSFKPELGISKTWGPLILELASGIRFYTDNNDFFDGKTLEVSPVYSVQAHLIYSFTSGIWLGLDGLYYTGGRGTIDGRKGQSLENARIGLTLALPINRHNSVKLYGSTNVYTRTGTDADVLGIAWQFRWGGGL
ncbi:MAG: transporter [Polyangiales bacterium]